MRTRATSGKNIEYKEQDVPDPYEAIDLFRAAKLNGPLDDPDRMKRMFDEAQHCVSVRDADGRLIGVARTLTDFVFNAFIADLAVHPDYQGQGIGTELLKRSSERWPDVKFLVHPGGDSRDFYTRRGFSVDEAVVLGRRK